MSIENEPLKLLPHDPKRLVVPPAFVPLMNETARGTTLANLADLLREGSSETRFTFLAKFLLYLYDEDLLADSRHVKLAEALRPEHFWSRSLMAIPLWSHFFSREKRTERRQVEVSFLAVAVISLSFAALERSVSGWAFGEKTMASPFSLWIAIVVAFSVGRTVRALAELALGRSTGRMPSTFVEVDLVSVSLQPGSTAYGANLFGFFASVIGIGLCASVGALDDGSGIFAFAALLAVFAETNPFAKSAMTDALKSLYASYDESRSPHAEATIRRFHLGACAVWCVSFLAFAFSFVVPILNSWRSLFGEADLVGRIALVVGAAKLLGLVTGWLADIVGTYTGFDGGERAIRNLWRRKSPGLAAFGQKSGADVDFESLPIIRQIEPETRRRLLESAKIREIPEGFPLIRQGEVDRVLYVVLEGRMAVAKRFRVARGKSRRKVVAFLGSGAVFGEAGFFFSHARTADVVALEPTRVLAIRHDPSMKTLDAKMGEELQTRIWFLQTLVSGSFLQEVPTEALDAVISSGRVIRVPAGNRVIQEGEAADACYFIVQGRATVTQNLKAINKLGAGDVFGEIALMRPGILRTATVHADTELLLIAIDGVNFWGLLRSHLPLAIEVERLAKSRLGEDRSRTANR